jgi:hypothetical protein
VFTKIPDLGEVGVVKGASKDPLKSKRMKERKKEGRKKKKEKQKKV